jgi:uncharacterized protein (DUF58 family)
MLTTRGRIVLALGPVLYVVAWAAGSRALYPVAVGLVLLAGLAWTWVGLLAAPMTLRRTMPGGARVEGEDVEVALELETEGRLVPSTLTVVERISRVGTVEASLRRAGPRLRGRCVLRRVPRGRYAHEASDAVVEDPFGLARAVVPLAARGSLLVYPRLAPLRRVFTETGLDLRDGRRLLLRRPSGFDLHSVRDYQQGESLRRVHWRSTAHRGRLMVKELEDEPRDEVAVLLDAAAEAVVGDPPDSSFDLQVRAAGSLLRAHVERGRRSVLVVGGMRREERRVNAAEADWAHALELLASVEPGPGVPPGELMASNGVGAAARALELVVVTARLTPDLVDRLAHRASGGGTAALVYVDAASFASKPAAAVREPGLLRLQTLGVPVAVLRRGDALTAVLGGTALREAASG